MSLTTKLFDNDTDAERKEYFKEMNEFFNNLKKCDQPHVHGGSCCYLGTIDERLAKYKEIRERKKRIKRRNFKVVKKGYVDL